MKYTVVLHALSDTDGDSISSVAFVDAPDRDQAGEIARQKAASFSNVPVGEWMIAATRRRTSPSRRMT